jgi:hypothetical protein
VSGGGGFVVIHAADNSFPEWPAYNEMIGLGGWGNRSEKDGPYQRVEKGVWNFGGGTETHRKGAAGEFQTPFSTRHLFQRPPLCT